MERLTRISWGILALIHVIPAGVFFFPSIVTHIYGDVLNEDIGILLIHRGALFFSVLVSAIFALFDVHVRKVCSVIVSISILGYLYVYVSHGMPFGELRKIAIVDLSAIIPLAFVTYMAWRKR